MRRITTVLLTTLFSIIAVPALAAWDRIASIDIDGGRTHEFNMENFAGNVIGLTASQSDVMCDRVSAIFAGGDERPIFRGKLAKGLSIRVDLPPGVVDRVTFNCHAVHGRTGRVDIAADTGAEDNSGRTRG